MALDRSLDRSAVIICISNFHRNEARSEGEEKISVVISAENVLSSNMLLHFVTRQSVIPEYGFVQEVSRTSAQVLKGEVQIH